MTIASETRYVEYTGNAATTVFAFPFFVDDIANLYVNLVEISSGTATPLTATTDYTYTGIGDVDGGSITYPIGGPGISSDFKIRIDRTIPITQPVTVTNQTRYNADVVMRVWDRITMIMQQLNSGVQSSMRLRDGVVIPPLDSLTADSAVVVNSDATGIAMGPTTSAISTANASAVSAAADAARAEAAAILAETLLPSVRPVTPATPVVSDGTLTEIEITGIYTASDQILLFIGGSLQPARDTHYTIAAGALTTTVTFSAPIPSGLEVYYIALRQYQMPTMAPGIIDMPDGSTALDLWYRKRGYTSRAFFVANQSGVSWQEGDVVFAGSLAYERQTGATAITDLQDWVPHRWTFPDHFKENATPGTTDMTAAFLSAVAFSRRVYVKAASYLTSAPVVSGNFDQHIVCENGRANILGNHETGPIIQFKKSYWRLAGIRLDATGARLGAAITDTNVGLIVGDFTWDNPTDGNAGASGNNGIFEGCIIENQPSHGILDTGGQNLFQLSLIQDNGGHGHYVSWGDELGLAATTLGFPGFSKISQVEILNNGGHKIALGGPNTGQAAGGGGSVPGNAIYRMDILNCDGSGNATDAAVRFVDREWYLVGEGIYTRNNAIGSTGIYLAGRQHRHMQNRMVENTVATPGQIGDLTSYGNNDIVIEGTDLNSPSVTITNVWELDAGVSLADQIIIRQANTASETHIASSSDRAKLVEWQFGTSKDCNGTMLLGGSSVATVVALSAVTPTVTFATPDDFSPSYTSQSAGYFENGGAAFIQGNLLFDTNAYSGTVAGPFLINLSALPFNMDSDAADRCGLNIGSMSNIVYDTGQLQATMYAAGAKQLRLSFNNSGAAREDADTVNIPASTSNIGISFSGWVKLA